MPAEELIPMSGSERALLEQVAAARGITVDEAARQLAAEAIAQRFKRHTGRAPARVYQLTKPNRGDLH